MKRFFSFATVLAITASLCCAPVSAAERDISEQSTESVAINYNRSIPLEVKGNRIVEQGTDNTVVLRGVNVPSMGWGMAEHIFESMTEVYDSWEANLIRLPIQPKFWFNDSYNSSGVLLLTKEQYRGLVDDMVRAAQARGKYIILDCHTYVMPLEESLEMWKELAVKYGNNSAVLFGLLNEPHDIKPTGVDAGRSAWDVWRNGGQITISGKEVRGVGHQELLDEIRKLGANNICIAGGLNWAFDISGLADGYDNLEHGYRLTDTAEGNGVVYDSHAYPVKGARDSWNKTIGPVRKVAPILIGEWGWDAGDKAISGGDCTADIWMNQLMKWMDDEYNEYDGIPVNWTGWNLHMSSSPRMIDSWDFKTTAYNGTYIKERLQSYGNTPEKQDGVYETDFSADIMRGYSGVSGKSAAAYSEENENVVINHQATAWHSTLDFPYEWDMNGLETIALDISGISEKGDVSAETMDIGLYGSDMEIWTKPVEVDGDTKTVTIGVDELTRRGNALTDGKLNGAVTGVYIGSTSAMKGTVTVDNLRLTKSAEPSRTAKECPHTDTGAELYMDIDNTDFASQKLVNGPGDGAFFRSENVTETDYNGEPTIVKHIEYNRINGPWGGSAQYNLFTVPTKDARYFTVCLRGSGTAQTIGVSIGDKGSFSVNMPEGDTNWHQYIYCLDGNIEYPEDIKYVKFTAGTKIESSFYADNFGFSIEKPELKIPYAEKSFVYDFATYNKSSYKYEAQISTQTGSEGDTITAAKADGGMDSDTQALSVSYTRSGSMPSRAIVRYSSSDFFKGNTGDDERTACRKTLKSDMETMIDLVFYGKSTSGKTEEIDVAVVDAANGMTTPTDTQRFILTDKWQQFRAPFDSFNVTDGGMSLDPGRVRGFIFASAAQSGSGSFMIDNITHTNTEKIDWSEPTATPEPTSTPEPTATPEPGETTPVPTEGAKVVNTAEEFLALTAADGHVILGSDIDLGTSGFKTRCEFVIDLNGHTLSSTCASVIEMAHKLMITDSVGGGGIINNNTNTSYAVKCAIKNSELNIDGVSLTAASQAVMINGTGTRAVIKNTVINGGAYAVNIANGSLTLENVTTNNDTNYKGYALYINNESDVTVNGGEYLYNGNVSSIVVASGARLTINNGKFTNGNYKRGVINTNKGFCGTVTINGGYFENTYDGEGYTILDGDEGTAATVPHIMIGGGQFLDGFSKTKPALSTSMTEITGGSFIFDPSEYVDAVAYDVRRENGMYSVIKKGDTDGYSYQLELDGDNIGVNVSIPSSALETDVMYTAVYDPDGRLIRIYREEPIRNVNTYAKPEGADTVKIFIWNKDMKPLVNTK